MKRMRILRQSLKRRGLEGSNTMVDCIGEAQWDGYGSFGGVWRAKIPNIKSMIPMMDSTTLGELHVRIQIGNTMNGIV